MGQAKTNYVINIINLAKPRPINIQPMTLWNFTGAFLGKNKLQWIFMEVTVGVFLVLSNFGYYNSNAFKKFLKYKLKIWNIYLNPFKFEKQYSEKLSI
jgi:hypothetical protein